MWLPREPVSIDVRRGCRVEERGLPPNNGDAADRPNRHTFCFRKSCADFVGR